MKSLEPLQKLWKLDIYFFAMALRKTKETAKLILETTLVEMTACVIPETIKSEEIGLGLRLNSVNLT